MSRQLVIVLDFGGQYNQLIARRVRECGVYCEVKPYTTPLAELRALEPIGIIFTGAHLGDLLRLPAHGPPAGRAGDGGPGRLRPGVRQDGDGV